VRGLYESFAEGDIAAVTATWDDDIELREPEGIVGGGTLHGHEEILETLFAGLATDWTDVSVVPERFVDGGDTVVALTTWSGTYVETEKQVAFRGAHVFDFRNGKIVRWTSYADTALFNAATET
jgi:ketosteroid isomerase-like protein